MCNVEGSNKGGRPGETGIATSQSGPGRTRYREWTCKGWQISMYTNEAESSKVPHDLITGNEIEEDRRKLKRNHNKKKNKTRRND